MRLIPTAEEMKFRIQRDINYFDGNLPERDAIAWRGYLAALGEWGLLSHPDLDAIKALLPPIDADDDPTSAILVGRPGYYDDGASYDADPES